ncbi:MAG: hypothetical protein QW728_00795, partial [Thermoplasmata archaeon]
ANTGWIVFSPDFLEWRIIDKCRITDIPRKHISADSPGFLSLPEGWLISGPAWTGPLWDVNYVDSVISRWELLKKEIAERYTSAGMAKQYFQHISATTKLLSIIGEECRISSLFYYNQDSLAKRAGKNSPSRQVIIDELRKNGYNASATHIDPKGIKTDAPLSYVLNIVNQS